MHIKNYFLTIPAWKAGVYVLFLVFGISVIFEIVLSHTIFHVFDRMIVKFEQQKKEDVEDLDDISKSEQIDYCHKYKWLKEEKEFLSKSDPSTPGYDFNKDTILSHEKDIQFAIKNHQFNLEKCEATLKSEKA
jgi:hypothetical protein